jgi:hypothetical protein
METDTNMRVCVQIVEDRDLKTGDKFEYHFESRDGQRALRSVLTSHEPLMLRVGETYKLLVKMTDPLLGDYYSPV